MAGDLLQENTGSAMKRRKEQLFAFFSGARWTYAIMIALAFVAFVAIVMAAVQSYRAIDRGNPGTDHLFRSASPELVK